MDKTKEQEHISCDELEFYIKKWGNSSQTIILIHSVFLCILTG
jgi:hypothetical protein